jgi:putative alpha-1,2-mannosidase
MSAWYILSSLGFYPVNPANGTFVLGSPQVKKAVLHMPNQRRFVIRANHISRENIYQEDPRLNHKLLQRNFIRYDEIVKGGRLKFQMTNQ